MGSHFGSSHFGSRLRFKSSRALDFSCLHEFCPLTETMDMTELLDAADSSPESLRLEPKWLRDTYKRQISTFTTESLEAADISRLSLTLEPKWLWVTYTYEIEMHEMTEWMEAAKDISLMRNKTKESEKLWIEWNKQNLCYEYLDNAVDLCENALSKDFGAILVLSDIFVHLWRWNHCCLHEL